MTAWTPPSPDRLRPFVDVGTLRRVDHRLELVVHSMLERLPDEHRVRVWALGLAAAYAGLQPHTAHDADGNLWLVLPMLSGQPWMLVPGYEVGLWWIDGQLWYCPDPIHDDDLVDVNEC